MHVMFRCVLLGALSMAPIASAQGAVADVLNGKLVKPEAGVWAWYEIDDAESGDKLLLKQAITSEERVRRKTGYWVETRIRPEVGLPVTYLMLLTGPATDPDNVHALYYQVRDEDPIQGDVEALEASEPAADLDEVKPVDVVSMPTPQGNVTCKHYRLPDGSEAWISDEVPPLGIVRLKSAKGTMLLQRYGKGGPEAEPTLKIANGDDDEPEDDADRDSDDNDDKNRGRVKRNFGGRTR